jgi:GNAT superfamily N-acetyltransferase
MEPVTIRPAQAEDADALVTLVRGLADFEHLDGPDAAGAARLRRDLADPARVFEALVAEVAGTPVGYALYFFTYSTFRARPKLFLEDLFVRPEHRNRGIGRALFVACARVAARRGCCQLEWTVLHWNEAARRFYRRLGGERDTSWQIFTLDDATIGELAGARLPEGITAAERS